jgi:hypothetical protein
VAARGDGRVGPLEIEPAERLLARATGRYGPLVDSAVLTVLRRSLEVDRDRGTPFPDAWATAVKVALLAEPDEREHRNWDPRAQAHSLEWSRAYVGVAPTAPVRACQDLEGLVAVAA